MQDFFGFSPLDDRKSKPVVDFAPWHLISHGNCGIIINRISNLGLSVGLWSGHPERRAKPEVEGSLVGKGDPSTPPRAAPLRMTAQKWAKDSPLNPNLIISLYTYSIPSQPPSVKGKGVKGCHFFGASGIGWEWSAGRSDHYEQEDFSWQPFRIRPR